MIHMLTAEKQPFRLTIPDTAKNRDNTCTKEWPSTNIGTKSPSIDLPEALRRATWVNRSRRCFTLLYTAVLQGNLLNFFGTETFF
jgi:hypothetical protein